MKTTTFLQYAAMTAVTLALGVVALGVGTPQHAKTFLWLGGHTFGIGEQQVYAIEQSADLSIRFRDAQGIVRSKSYRHRSRSSVAFTIEGVTSAGRPVLAIATANPVPQYSPSATSSPYPVSAASPLPSPELDAQGALTVAGNAADLGPASILLSGLTSGIPTPGSAWKSSGAVRLPFATVGIAVANSLASPAPAEGNPVLQIKSSGSADVHGKISVPGLGQAILRGAGSAAGTTFVDTQDKLLLGLTLSSSAHGNAAAGTKRGTYDLKMQVVIVLAHYVAGLPPVIIGPGYVIASGYVGSYASPDTGNYSTAPPNPIAVPAATNTEYTGSPLPTYQPSMLPESSLPPIPIPLASDQPIASPPPGPTPTPTPTRY